MSNTFKAGWTESTDGSSAAALSMSRAAVAAKEHYVTGFEVVIISGTTTSAITVELRDGSTVKWKSAIKTGASVGEKTGVIFPDPIRMTTNTAVNLVTDDPGSDGTITGNIMGFTE